MLTMAYDQPGCVISCWGVSSGQAILDALILPRKRCSATVQAQTRCGATTVLIPSAKQRRIIVAAQLDSVGLVDHRGLHGCDLMLRVSEAQASQKGACASICRCNLYFTGGAGSKASVLPR
jgi:hypothetical protein